MTYRSRLLRKSLITMILATLLVAQFPFTSSARTLDEISDDIKSTSEKRADFETQGQSVLDEIKATESKLNVLNQDIGKLEDQLAVVMKLKAEAEAAVIQKQIEFEEKKAELKERTKIFEGRLADLYKRGDFGYIEVIIGATDFSDFISRVNYLTRIIRSDKDLMDEITKTKEDIEEDRDILEAKRQEIEEREKAIEDIKEPLDIKRAEVDTEKYNKEILYSQVEDDKSTQDVMLAELLQEQQSALVRARGRGGDSPGPSPRGFVWPTYGTITCTWGWHDCNVHVGRPHHGLDIAANAGTVVVSPAAGTVVQVYWSDAVGNTVEIDHGGGITTRYCHLLDVWCSNGQYVGQGASIGTVGNTGYLSHGAHLHFEVYDIFAPDSIDGTVNPLHWLP